ncbi:hypothetical protein LRAMOSA00922 [Lichtheimia ramosa]|uniref:Arrestin C-terminal-like domain-containing protein n=1 Tax=Lichtheimia ramosa TaxID=688394 RepID=A0A077W9R7_9FUNG|nr:hypothetical protein LRAMOSA00922 [Lichtheimia ramosa]
MAISSLHVHTESDAIHLYTGENMIPNSSYVLHGHVELNIQRPVRIRQISVQFKGTVHNVISNELIQHHQDISANSDFWPITIVSKQSTAIFERMSRFAVSTALGYAISNQKIVRQKVDLLPADATTTRIEPGVSRWPFAIEIDHPEKLLPSLLLPRHTIRYDLIVHVQLASLRDKITQRKLRITKPIHVLCHAYPSLHILDFQPRVRYRGCREGHMRYEVSMVKFVPLNQKLRLVCHFFPLCPEARISTIAMLIEQHELFPLRTGNIKENETFPSHMYVSKTQKPIVKEYTVNDDDTLDYLPFDLDIASPYIAQDVDTLSLKITHKMRIIVYFADPQVRRMSLSFPLTIGTIPSPYGESTNGIRYSVNEDILGEMEDDDDNDWISMIAADSNYHRHRDSGSAMDDGIMEKLPTYYDVLHEGPPPAAFLDDDLSHYPSPHA